MKTLILVAVFLGALCISYSAAIPSFSDRQSKLLKVLQQLNVAEIQSPQDFLVEEQEDKTALAQLFLRLLENEVQKQDMSDAEMESIFSGLKEKFSNLGNKIKGAFNKVKNFFHGKR